MRQKVVQIDFFFFFHQQKKYLQVFNILHYE